MSDRGTITLPSLLLKFGIILSLLLAGLAVYKYKDSIASALGFQTVSQNAENSRSSRPTLTPDAQSQTPSDDEEERIDWAPVLDALGGHPDDTQLPRDALGASDSVLSATDAGDVATVLRSADALAFARDRGNGARFLFALGRAARAHGYRARAKVWLEEASTRGSAAAKAYLAYLVDEEGDKERAKSLLREALALGFNNLEARKALAELDAAGGTGSVAANAVTQNRSIYEISRFKRGAFIDAFRQRNYAALRADDLVGLAYTVGLHDALWQMDVMFLTNSQLILELDPEVGPKGHFVLASSATVLLRQMNMTGDAALQVIDGILGSVSSGFQFNSASIATLAANSNRGFAEIQLVWQRARAQGVADARRLAIGFEGNEASFRQIYNGLKAYIMSR